MDQLTPPLHLKVCGMKDPANIADLLKEAPDYMGMIFYERSPRHVEGMLSPEDIPPLGNTRLIGVFVDAPMAYIKEKINAYGLDGVQLHGGESPDYCQEIRSEGMIVIKAFSIGKEEFNFSQLTPYEERVDFFLFDTKGKLPGGNGVTFRWDILKGYLGALPFFLSGGIHPDHIEKVTAFRHPKLHALDINSQFEISPGFKDIDNIRTFWGGVKLTTADSK